MTSRRARTIKDGQGQTRGAELYPFDPSLRADQASGLDRLRCIADRNYASVLFDIYLLAERNEALAKQENCAAEKTARIRSRIRLLAREALAGELGDEAHELARHVALGADGRVCDDDRTLAELARALMALGVTTVK